MTHNFRHILYTLASAIAICSLYSCETINDPLPSYSETSIVGVGDEAPSFSTISTDGEILTIGPGNNTYTLLILFSHTCPDCQGLLDELHKELNTTVLPPQIIAISRGGTEQEISQYKAEHHYTIPMVADSSKEIYLKYATMYVPRCYIIDNENIIRCTSYEYQKGDIAKISEAYSNIISD
jgi:peroxiredoxin